MRCDTRQNTRILCVCVCVCVSTRDWLNSEPRAGKVQVLQRNNFYTAKLHRQIVQKNFLVVKHRRVRKKDKSPLLGPIGIFKCCRKSPSGYPWSRVDVRKLKSWQPPHTHVASFSSLPLWRRSFIPWPDVFVDNFFWRGWVGYEKGVGEREKEREKG